MSIPRKQTLYAIADRYNRTASMVGNSVVFNNTFTPLSNNPIGWDQVQIQFKTVQKYFSLNRDFTVPLTFVHDGARIIREKLYKGKGYAEELYLIILQWDAVPTSSTVGQHILEYKGRIDLTQGISDDPLRGITVNTKEAGAVAFLNANDAVTYELPCDDTNPKAIKILFDGITLYDKYNYSVVNVDIVDSSTLNYTALPMSFINNEGDSVGVTHGSPSYEPFDSYDNYIPTSSNNFFSSAYPITIDIEGSVSFKWHSDYIHSGRVVIFYRTTKDAHGAISSDRKLFDTQNLIPGVTYNVNVAKTFNLAAGEKLFLIVGMFDNAANNFTITLQPTTISAKFSSINPPSTAWALRPLDLLQQIVSKMTNGRFTADSNFFKVHNNIVALGGESIRELPDAKIKVTFADFFQSYNGPYNLGLKIINDVIWVEPKADLYNDNTTVFDLGEVSDFKITIASDYIVNTLKTGGPTQDYQNFGTTNGRYEPNSTFLWQLPNIDTKKELNLVTKWRIDPMGIEFIRGVLNNKSTTDNKADNEVFMVNISDETQTTTTPHNTSRLVNVNTNPLLPVFLERYNNSIINNNKPTVKGYTKPNTKVGILVDTVQDGFTTSDQYGLWSYNIQTSLSSYAVDISGTVTNTGIHLISAANTDGSGVVSLGAGTTDISVTIDTTVASPFLITSPEDGDYLFNNLPLIKGVAQFSGTIPVTVSIDGVSIGTVVPDGSCLWQLQLTTPLSEGAHTITANYNGANTSVTFNVSYSNLLYPLITTVNESEEEIIYTNLPIIRGVAKPNSTFLLYFDYGTTGPIYDPLGNLAQWGIFPVSIIADANGNWSYAVTLAMPEGEHEISTTATNQQVLLSIDGYKLKRLRYNSFSGMPAPRPDNVLRTDIAGAPFNIVELSPKEQLLAHANELQFRLFQQPTEKITFQTADKNKNLSRSINGVTITDKKDVQISSLGNPLALPYFFEFKTKVPLTFAQIMSKSESGNIRFTVNGTELEALIIGELTAKPVNQEAQTWKLLASPKNSLQTLLNLSL